MKVEMKLIYDGKDTFLAYIVRTGTNGKTYGSRKMKRVSSSSSFFLEEVKKGHLLLGCCL